MQEKLVIVPKKTTGGHKAGMIAFFVLTCLCLVLSMFVSPVMFLVPTIIFGVIWYLFAFRSEVEYEYTYYDFNRIVLYASANIHTSTYLIQKNNTPYNGMQ